MIKQTCLCITMFPDPGQLRMVEKLDNLLEREGEQFTTSEAVVQLRNVLKMGHQTEGEQHDILAKLLKASLHIHYGDGPETACTQHLGDPLGVKTIHVWLQSRVDGAGSAEGHFDFLVKVREQPQPDLIAGSVPQSVTHGITVRGPEIISAILGGQKWIENRMFAMPNQWIALHQGKSAASPAMVAHIRENVPNLDTSQFSSGHIQGLIHISTSVTLNEYREMCGCDCDFTPEIPQHKPDCKCNKFVLGPVLNIISHRLTFRKPIAANGALGKWPLTATLRQSVERELKNGNFSLEVNDEAVRFAQVQPDAFDVQVPPLKRRRLPWTSQAGQFIKLERYIYTLHGHTHTHRWQVGSR